MSAPYNFSSGAVSGCEMWRTNGQTKVRPISSEEELDNALFNQQEKHRAEKDRGDIARGHVSDYHDGAGRRRAMKRKYKERYYYYR